MNENARRWRILAGGVAAGVAGVVGFAGSTATAEPVFPQPPLPGPATVTQTVTVMPAAGPTAPVPAAGQSGVTPVTAAAPTPAATPTAAPQTLVPATSVTLADFLRDKGVRLEPQVSSDFKALNIVLPMPAGWAAVPDPNVPDAFAVIADRVGGDGLYTSNAQVVVYKLIGDFDPKEAITHGFIDNQQLPAWRSTDASLADYGGMPSSLIEGTYRENAMTLNTSRRQVIATSGPDRYLVSLAVTTTVQQAVAAAGATDAIVTGFKVSAPAPASPPPGPPRRRRVYHPCRGCQPCRHYRASGPGRGSAATPRIVWPMLIAAVLCLCAAVATAAVGGWLLTRPHAGDPVRQLLRAVAPTQLAAAAMLASGGAVALSARPETGLLVVIVCVVGAVSTVAAGCWQSAKVAARQEVAGCDGGCASCTLSCN